MVFIGTISYSIYLWHTIILDIYAVTDIARAMPPEKETAGRRALHLAAGAVDLLFSLPVRRAPVP